MKFKGQYRIESIRLKGYDYSQPGAYFITMCTYQQENLFGEIVKGEIQLNSYGRIVHDTWASSTENRPEIQLDEFVIMPNHVHGIVVICNSLAENNDTGNRNNPIHVEAIHELPLRQQRRNMILPKWVGRFKMMSAKQINKIRQTPGVSVWQRDYYEHIIRDEVALNRIRTYIANNPSKWDHDKMYNLEFEA